MKLKLFADAFSVGKISDMDVVDWKKDFMFTAKTDEECALVCRTCDMPKTATPVEDGWRAMRIEGILDFSLIGIIAKISGLLAEKSISVFVISTYNTDYILVKETQLDEAIKTLEKNGYEIEQTGQA